MPLSNTGKTPEITGAVTRSRSRPRTARSLPPRIPAPAGREPPMQGESNPRAGASGSGDPPVPPTRGDLRRNHLRHWEKQRRQRRFLKS